MRKPEIAQEERGQERETMDKYILPCIFILLKLVPQAPWSGRDLLVRYYSSDVTTSIFICLDHYWYSYSARLGLVINGCQFAC